jgi:hypothetical protein
LLEALILAAAEHGNGLATLCGDRHGAHWFHVPDDDLTMFGEASMFGYIEIAKGDASYSVGSKRLVVTLGRVFR